MKAQKKGIYAETVTDVKLPNKTTELNVIPTTEKGKIALTHKGNNVVECDLTVKPEFDSPVKYQMRWFFDFSECSREEIEEIAANYLKIRVQDNFRKVPVKERAFFNDKMFNVKLDLLNKTRVSNKNPLKRVQKLLEVLSLEEKQALLAQLQQ